MGHIEDNYFENGFDDEQDYLHYLQDQADKYFRKIDNADRYYKEIEKTKWSEEEIQQSVDTEFELCEIICLINRACLAYHSMSTFFAELEQLADYGVRMPIKDYKISEIAQNISLEQIKDFKFEKYKKNIEALKLIYDIFSKDKTKEYVKSFIRIAKDSYVSQKRSENGDYLGLGDYSEYLKVDWENDDERNKDEII